MGNLNRNSNQNQNQFTKGDKLQLWFCAVAVAYFILRFTVGILYNV